MRALLGAVEAHIEQTAVLILEYRVEKGDGPKPPPTAKPLPEAKLRYASAWQY